MLINDLLIVAFLYNVIYVLIYLGVFGFSRTHKVDPLHVLFLMAFGFIMAIVSFFAYLVDCLEGDFGDD